MQNSKQVNLKVEISTKKTVDVAVDMDETCAELCHKMSALYLAEHKEVFADFEPAGSELEVRKFYLGNGYGDYYLTPEKTIGEYSFKDGHTLQLKQRFVRPEAQRFICQTDDMTFTINSGDGQFSFRNQRVKHVKKELQTIFGVPCTSICLKAIPGSATEARYGDMVEMKDREIIPPAKDVYVTLFGKLKIPTENLSLIIQRKDIRVEATNIDLMEPGREKEKVQPVKVQTLIKDVIASPSEHYSYKLLLGALLGSAHLMFGYLAMSMLNSRKIAIDDMSQVAAIGVITGALITAIGICITHDFSQNAEPKDKSASWCASPKSFNRPMYVEKKQKEALMMPALMV